MALARALLGLGGFCLLAWLLSSERRRFPWRVVLWGLAAQFVLGFLVLRTELGRRLFETIAAFVSKLISMVGPAATTVFGSLSEPAGPAGYVLAFAGNGLLVIVFFAALMGVLYHLGVMQRLVWLLARVMKSLLGVSGAEAMAMAANVFVGQTEAPLVVRPYVARMTVSELNALMTGGFATVAGSVMALYMGMVGPEYAPHLLTASVMSAPAAFVIAKIVRPEIERSETAGRVELRIERSAHNLIEAAANGTQDGLKLWLNVVAMLVAFLALVNLVNWPLGALGETLGLEGGLSLSRLFGWLLAPLAWLMGVDGWRDCQLFGGLLGTKLAVNEFIAFQELAALRPESAGAQVFDSARSARMAAYALCGFANFGSIGIQLGGITPLAPERKADLSRLALRAMLGGAFASWMTATVAGAFL